MPLSIQLKLKNSLKLSPNIEQSVNLLKANELEIEYLISEFLYGLSENILKASIATSAK